MADTTPGEWSASVHVISKAVEVLAQDCIVVAVVAGADDDERKANGTLLAAAPDLKAVAQLALEVLAHQKKYFKTRDREDLIASKELEKKLRDTALLALAKARAT